MTYLDYIVQFQRLRRQQPFPSTSADLYYHLLWVSNGLGWKNPFNEGSSILMASLGMTDKTLTSARDKLIEAGLIKYWPGKKGTFSTYELLTIGQNYTENFRNNRGESGEKSGRNREELGRESGGIHKSKIKSKTKEATASVSEQSASLTPAPIAEPWAAWLAEHAPTVQRLKSPLTADQYAKLTADFGEPMVREVLAGMENYAGLLKKYTSANLTARDWCKRRCPNGKPPTPPALPAAGPTQPTTPDLNPEVVAQRQAQRDAEAAEARRRVRNGSQAS